MTELLSASCDECGLLFTTTPAHVEAASKIRTPDSEIRLAALALRRGLREAGWNVFRPDPDDHAQVVFQPTCPKCTDRVTKQRSAAMPHPAWGCDGGCAYDLEGGWSLHWKSWMVSDVAAFDLTTYLFDDGSKSYTLSMPEEWPDFSADEALQLASALMDICQLLDEHDLRKTLNEQVDQRLAVLRAS